MSVIGTLSIQTVSHVSSEYEFLTLSSMPRTFFLSIDSNSCISLLYRKDKVIVLVRIAEPFNIDNMIPKKSSLALSQWGNKHTFTRDSLKLTHWNICENVWIRMNSNFLHHKCLSSFLVHDIEDLDPPTFVECGKPSMWSCIWFM